MSEETSDRSVKGIGHGVTVHNALEWVLEEMAKRSGESEAECPNIWNYTMLAMVYAEYMEKRTGGDSPSSAFLKKSRELDNKYGTERLHKMTKEERWERAYTALAYFTELGAHQLQEEEQQWADDELEITRREESNAR